MQLSLLELLQRKLLAQLRLKGQQLHGGLLLHFELLLELGVVGILLQSLLQLHQQGLAGDQLLLNLA